jgi:hypothetical protein
MADREAEESCNCKHAWLTLNGRFTFGDPESNYAAMGGFAARPEERQIAYKATGEFPYSTTFTWTAQDDYTFYPTPRNGNPGSAYTLNDADIVPDEGSVNPFVPGNDYFAPNRKYTLWVWPDDVPVPEGLGNYVLYTTTPADPNDTQIRWTVVERQYTQAPGHIATLQLPKVQAYHTSNLDQPVKCPISQETSTESEVESYRAQVETFVGPGFSIPDSGAGDNIYFQRIPAPYIGGPEGDPVGGSVNYLAAGLDPSKLAITTMHKVPTFFNNQKLSEPSPFGEYQVRYTSMVAERFPIFFNNHSSQNTAVLRPDGAWSTIWLPISPRLSRNEVRQIKEKAAELGYNVKVQGGPSVAYPTGTLIIIRYKIYDKSFRYKCTNVPSWVDPDNPATEKNNYQDWSTQGGAEYFSEFASNPSNMGPYWVGGTYTSVKQFLSQSE